MHADGAQESLQVEFKNSSLLSVVSVLAAIMTLQTTVIFIVVIIIACKRKGTVPRGGRNTTTNESFEVEDQVYETVDAGEKGMDAKFPAHGCGRGRGKVHFNKNESYAIPKEVVAI